MLLNSRSLSGFARTLMICTSKNDATAATTIHAIHKRSKTTLPDLPYDYAALEPIISAEIMQLHHSKHHQTYVNNSNVASEKLAEAVEKGNKI